MALLHRHQLALLSDAGWSAILARPCDAQARDCLAHWAEHRLPLVVTRQPAEAGARGLISLGLPAPGRWGRRRLALQVPLSAVMYFDEFPLWSVVLKCLPVSARAPAQQLQAGLAEVGAHAHVFGSTGWQALTGLDHRRPGSDLDVWVGVDDAAHADRVTACLLRHDASLPRLDGELMFGDGTAIAWREWAVWRRGDTRSVMTKRLTGVALLHDVAALPTLGHEGLAA